MGRPIFARSILPQEQDELDALFHHPVKALARRAAVVLLSAKERYRTPEIATLVGMHQSSVRYWIHRFNKGGMSALRPSDGPGAGSRVNPEVRATLIQLATTPPREMGLKFTTWTLRELREYLVEHEMVEISHETIRRILKEENIDWQASGALPENSQVHDLLQNTVSRTT